MNRLVYLFELDSARSSDREVVHGQKCLFKEIVGNGNCVVLSFNQLTDSVAFLTAIRSSDRMNDIGTLFREGALRVSQFGDTLTPSQYLQNALSRCDNRKEGHFLFSSFPLDSCERVVIDILQTALKNCNPSLIEQEPIACFEGRFIEASDCHNTGSASSDRSEMGNRPPIRFKSAAERRDFLANYIRMILKISMDDYVGNDQNEDSDRIPFSLFIYSVLGLGQGGSKTAELLGDSRKIHTAIVDACRTTEERESFILACELLESIARSFEEDLQKDGFSKDDVQNRSAWYQRLDRRRACNRMVCDYAQSIVDVCYNFTVERGIGHCTRHYLDNDEASFANDFSSKFNSLLEYRPSARDQQGVLNERNILLPWKNALRICGSFDKPSMGLTASPLVHEADERQEHAYWKRSRRCRFVKSIGVALLYIIMFVGIEFIFNILEDGFVSYISLFTGNSIFDDVIDIVVFGIVATLVSNLTSLPDIFDSIMEIYHGLFDMNAITKAEKNGIG